MLTAQKQSSDDWLKVNGEIVTKDNLDSYIPELKINGQNTNVILNKILAIDKEKGAWQEYFSVLENQGHSAIVDLIKNTDDLSKLTAEDLVKANQHAREAAIAHNAALQQQTLGAKAATVATKAFAIAGNMLLMWGISEVISIATKKITELANASQIAEEKATSFANSVNSAVKDMSSNLSTLSSLNDEYQRLSEGVNALGKNISLSTSEYDRYKEIIKQISDIMPNMTAYFNSQGEKIAFAKGELSDLDKEYEEYIKKQATEFLVNGDENGNKVQDALDNFNNNSKMGFWETLKNTIQNAFGSYDIDDLPVNTMISTLEALQNKSREEMIAYLNDIDLDANGQYLQTIDNRAKAIVQDILGITTGEIREMSDEKFKVLQESITQINLPVLLQRTLPKKRPPRSSTGSIQSLMRCQRRPKSFPMRFQTHLR